MYDKSLRAIREEFWKTFGMYMSPTPSASGERINWINYKTGHKAIKFTLELENNQALVALICRDPTAFNRLQLLKAIFVEHTGPQIWLWQHQRVVARLDGKDVRSKPDWPDLISFFKARLIELDRFWQEARDLMH